ncbi:ATP-binding protein [Cupriavidus sp. 8B]
MSKYQLSIKNRLLIWLLSTLIVISSVFIMLTYANERIALRDKMNDRLKQIAMSISPNLKKADLRQINLKLHHDKDDFVLQIWDSEAELIYQSQSDFTMPRYDRPGFSIAEWRGERWRVFVRILDKNTIQVAQSLNARKAIAEFHALHTIIPLILFIPVIALFIPLCVNRGLKSLTRLSNELDSRNSNTLGPLSADDQPAELAPLKKAIDTLLIRLGDALDIQRKFITDASHELRTPLSILQIQTQLVEQALGTGQEQIALADLKAGIKRTSHLVEQLLMTSRLESSASRDPFKTLYLEEIARDVMIELIPFANSRGIDLGMERMENGRIIGCEYQVRLLIRNFIDNAIRYTPQLGRVDVKIVRDDEKVHLSIEDSGPGIAAEDRTRVFDRFYRCLGHDVAGSGLGLAIVKQVAVSHDADIHLDVSQRLAGLWVTVSFRRDAALIM